MALIKSIFIDHKNYFSSVVLLGSKDEKYFCNQLKDSLNTANVYNLAGSLEILEIFELLKLCKFFIGNKLFKTQRKAL